MKRTGKNTYRILSLALCLCMVLGLMPAMPLVAEAATVPTYIASIGISQDGSSGSTGINDCKSELAGHTIIDVDLNDEAGGDYVYMGYKTTTDPAQAITGILFRVGKNPPNSISYGGSTFYLVGGSTEANTAKLGGYIDLNARAGGYYIYTYVTRDPNYGAPLTNLTVNRSSSYSGWYAGTDTNGNVMDLNDDASNYYMYLHYQRFSGNASSTFYYLTSGGSRTSSTTSVSVKNHTQSVSTTPSVPSTVTYDGRTFTFRGWREDNTASSSTVSPSYTYMTSKTYRAVYSATVTLSYNANGGSGAPSSQTATQYINAGSSSVSKTSHSFTISATKPTHDDSKCVFLGWSTGSSATSASHQPGQTITISSDTTLYAVWRGEHTANRTYVNNGADHTYTWPCCGKSVTEAHSYTDGFCVCGAMIPDAVATVSRNGKVVAAYTILNDAIQAVADCTADDKAVVTIMKDIDLGDSYQKITSGVFTIDLNGFEISSTNSDYGALYVYGATVTIRDSGEDGKITGKRAGIEVFDGELTVLDGTVSGGSSRNNCGVYATNSSTVTISGGTISGYYAVCAEASGVTISGGTVSGETAGVYTDGSNVTISSGSISGYYGVAATFGGGVIISGGTISGERYGVYADGSTMTVSGGSISGGNYDIRNYNSSIALTLGDDGVGARFPGGITVLNTTLNEILGEGTAYWQGNTMILPADDATEITGGDVVIKSTCPHASKSNYTDLKDGASHTYFCSGCNNTLTESHSYTNGLCVCGAMVSDAVASVSKNGIVTGAYTTLNDAIQAVRNCTAADKAVVTILQDIALGDSYQTISSGVFTIDLNGHEISSTKSGWGALYISGSAPNVTIQGTGENSKITGNNAGIEMSGATLTVISGTISSSSTYGIIAAYSTVTISGGTISSVYDGVYAISSTMTISGGTISGSTYGIIATYSTVTISGGSFSGDYGVYAYSASTVTISGGSISGGNYDLRNYNSTIILALGENGVGATFPGGITVDGTALNEILDEGAAYWQGNTMILPADGATEIPGGDVVIKAECKHPVDKTYTNNGDDHSYTYSCCNNTVTESHSYTNGLCVCGAMVSDAVASVSKNGIVTGAYTTLNDAIQAVRNCTAADKAVVTILQDIALGDSYQEISSGVFTVDLNSKTLSGTNSTYGVLYLNGFSVDVTVTDSGTGGAISGYYGVIATYNGRVTISGGTISGEQSGVAAEDLGTVTITGGTISGEKHGLAAYIGGRVIISGGTISGENHGVYANGGTVMIRGGSISGDTYDIFNSLSTMILTLGENGVGATFPGGIKVYDTTLNEILDEGVAYWQGNTMILPANNATEIPGGDVVIKAECKHPGDKTYTNNGYDHSYTYSCCNATVTEGHTYTNDLCACGAVSPDAVASVSKNGIVTGAYTTLNDAIQAVADCTDADSAVVTILQDIALGDSNQEISSGVFTINLNGHEISSTKSNYGALYINGADIHVTIQGAGENSKITGNHAGIYMRNNATLTIIGGTISGNQYGVNAVYSTVTIRGGTISGNYWGVYAYKCTVTISGGTISGDSCGVWTEKDSTVTISGGTISGDYGVDADNSTVTISGGTISSDYGVNAVYSTVTISGGTISSDLYGVDAGNSTVTISGGSISGGFYDISNSYSTVTLTLGDDGVGATFPGDITVLKTTLNEILDEGTAYWQGDKQINPADDDTDITGGDVVIKAACKHPGDKTYTNNGDDHTYTCSVCDATVTEGHTYIDGVCVCGVADVNVAVASTTVGGITTYYGTLGSAIQAVKDCTAADKAVVTILKDIALGDNYQTISSGVFTIDLNGHEISSTNDRWGALYLSGTDVNVTVQGAGESSKITGSSDGITVFDKAMLTITGGTISGDDDCGVYAVGSTVTINGGTISGDDCGVKTGYCTLIISDGTISGYFGVSTFETDLIISGGTISGDALSVYSEYSTMTISGGSISTGDQHIYSDNSTITLTLGENGVGARFLGGITVRCATLNEILGEGAAYWQGDKQIIPADGATAIFNGDVVIKAYVAPVYSGWTEIDGNWYYYDPDTGKPVTGITRVPYPAEVINGVTYAPDQESIDYAASKGQTFIDETTGLFWFDADGKFLSGYTGIVPSEDGPSQYAVNGHIAWHVGLVQVGEDYYYFIGDVDNGGNKMATGDIYANRNTTDFDMVVGGVYTFGEDGKLCKYEGITEVNGVLRYYENAQLMLGKGLIQGVVSDGTCTVTLESFGSNKMSVITVVREFLGLGLLETKELVESAPVLLTGSMTKDQAERFVAALQTAGATASMVDNLAPGGYCYVTSDGSLVVNANYWVAKTNGLNIVAGAYDFDENGYLIEPRPSDKDGVYFENGAWYYYENGKIGYNQGLISVNTTWYGADGSENVYSGYIYVRSSGKLATGSYYITNVENDNSGLFITGQKVAFSDIGIADAPKHGIVDVDGTLYFYQYNAIQYNAGLIEHNGGWIYVRSSGKLAVGDYWITNTNGAMDQGMYEFGADGYMVITDIEDGIVSENGVLYYYLDGKKQYGLGLRQLEGGSYIYVRTNGQLATGAYWITNHNGLLPEGMYTFGEDGILASN